MYKTGYIRAYDRPQRPTFQTLELDVVSTKVEAVAFADDVDAHFAEWNALPQTVKQNLNFDRHLTQKCEHSRKACS